MRLVQDHDRTLELYVHGGSNRGIEEVVVRAEDQFRALGGGFRGKVRTRPGFFTRDDEVFDVEWFRAWFRDGGREFHGAVAVPASASGVR